MCRINEIASGIIAHTTPTGAQIIGLKPRTKIPTGTAAVDTTDVANSVGCNASNIKFGFSDLIFFVAILS